MFYIYTVYHSRHITMYSYTSHDYSAYSSYLSWCSSRQSSYCQGAHTCTHRNTHTHTLTGSAESSQRVQIPRLWTVYLMSHLRHPLLPIPPVSSPFSISLHTLINLSTVPQTVNDLCEHVVCLHGPLICCLVCFVGCH